MRVRKRKNPNLIICPKTKQFTDLVVCAASCDRRLQCKEYRQRISVETLEKFVEGHPEYKIIGELMAGKKVTTKEKTFWVVNEDNTLQEVTEKEVMENPKEYINKQIWEKPPFKYEVVITLKRIKAD